VKIEPRPLWPICATIISCSALSAGDKTMRILPPLVIDESHIDEFMEKLSAAAASYQPEEVA
jgi:acetylornithine/N-succinyldiaminopimelate aminotransferase